MAAYVHVNVWGFWFAAFLNCKTAEKLIEYPVQMRINNGPSPV